MKTNSFLFLLLGAFLISCSKDYKETESIKDNPTKYLKIAKIIPSFSSVLGSKGFNTSHASNSFGSYFIAELNGSSIINISGSNYGTNQGTVFFEKYSNNNWTTTSSYTLNINSWNSTSIKVKLTSCLNSQPIAIARFRVVINGVSYNTPNFSVVPYIDGRQYEQCTWWVSKRTRENNLPSGNANYSNITASINANYIPTANDILSWGNDVHQAFIENVAVTSGTTANGNVTTYTVKISEANVYWSGNPTTSPQTYTTVIKIKNTNGVKTFVSPYNIYRSKKTAGALYYKAQ